MNARVVWVVLVLAGLAAVGVWVGYYRVAFYLPGMTIHELRRLTSDLPGITLRDTGMSPVSGRGLARADGMPLGDDFPLGGAA